MKKMLSVASVMALVLVGASVVSAQPDGALPELDQFWAEVSRAVAEGDFEGYAATYHADAILVSDAGESTYPIASALKGWQQGFSDTRAGKMTANVEFRFTKRLNDESTAHETGIFHYWAKPEEGEVIDSYLHIEALLVKKADWKMMMEYQKTPATKEEWAAAQ